MNNKAVTLSLLMAVLAVFFVSSYVTSIEDEARKKFGTEILVVKAKQNLMEQQTINETDLELVAIPENFKEPGAIYFVGKKDKDEEAMKTLKELAGTVALVPIQKGEQINYNKIVSPSIRTGLSPQIAPGKRAVSVPVTEITGVGKLVKPGDRVDLIAVIDGGGGKENKLVKTVLQDVVVLAVGRNVTNNAARIIEKAPVSGKETVRPLTTDSNFASVTLEVEPQQAQLVALMMSNSENALTLALRNNDDTEHLRLEAYTLTDFLGPDVLKVQRRPTSNR